VDFFWTKGASLASVAYFGKAKALHLILMKFFVITIKILSYIYCIDKIPILYQNRNCDIDPSLLLCHDIIITYLLLIVYFLFVDNS